jgi:hypothetical protein
MGGCSPSLYGPPQRDVEGPQKGVHISRMLAKKEDTLANCPEEYEAREPLLGMAIGEGWACDMVECLWLSLSKFPLPADSAIRIGRPSGKDNSRTNLMG